ncbi:diguanylate cyclase domain-containing protein [Undibacterium sp.]|uniref:diguanylate cyclase domain-containing protein n=1 Tax=Undibacterium sp. TaxID=1914977 RepID=UPI002C5B8E6A|nr:diguanylate cyclase [Undibacterium sp.]HTD07174.1 diguanylate cyclase [Undibacterium sp.]
MKARVLVVDDSHDNVEVLSMLLNAMGYVNVDGTTDSAAVCGLHLQNDFDLILLDMQMPGVSGFQVMEEIKSHGNDAYLPVLAITGNSDLKIRALEAGARDFIAKPFDSLELEKRIHNMLEVRLLYKQVTAHSKAQEALALQDVLTGLPNRRLLKDRLDTAIKHASRNSLAVGVLYLDLDGFKQVNDSFGHDCGDKLLKIVADRLLSTSREEDTIARIGGDEFVIVLAKIRQASDVHRLASELVRAVSEPCIIDGHLIKVTASIGVSFYPHNAREADDLVNYADKALYEAKRCGKNQYLVAGPDCGEACADDAPGMTAVSANWISRI